MTTLLSKSGATVSYRKSGSGPPLVLIHGSFSDHLTNWEFVLPMLDRHFTNVAVALRGRGKTDATMGHTIDDEALDTVSIIESLGEPVFLLGHSYGAQVALRAANSIPGQVRRLILYEPPKPNALDRHLPELGRLAALEAWDQFSWTFFHRALSVPVEELQNLKTAGLWQPIVNLAKASLGDLRAVLRSTFEPERFQNLPVPTLLQVGSESPHHLFVTKALAENLPNATIETMEGQAHEAMTTAPERYAASVIRFLATA